MLSILIIILYMFHVKYLYPSTIMYLGHNILQTFLINIIFYGLIKARRMYGKVQIDATEFCD